MRVSESYFITPPKVKDIWWRYWVLRWFLTFLSFTVLSGASQIVSLVETNKYLLIGTLIFTCNRLNWYCAQGQLRNKMCYQYRLWLLQYRPLAKLEQHHHRLELHWKRCPQQHGRSEHLCGVLHFEISKMNWNFESDRKYKGSWIWITLNCRIQRNMVQELEITGQFFHIRQQIIKNIWWNSVKSIVIGSKDRERSSTWKDYRHISNTMAVDPKWRDQYVV